MKVSKLIKAWTTEEKKREKVENLLKHIEKLK